MRVAVSLSIVFSPSPLLDHCLLVNCQGFLSPAMRVMWLVMMAACSVGGRGSVEESWVGMRVLRGWQW